MAFLIGRSSFLLMGVVKLCGRGSIILIENNKAILIKRVKDGSVYYMFPGGGIEKGKTPEEATVREAYE